MYAITSDAAHAKNPMCTHARLTDMNRNCVGMPMLISRWSLDRWGIFLQTPPPPSRCRSPAALWHDCTALASHCDISLHDCMSIVATYTYICYMSLDPTDWALFPAGPALTVSRKAGIIVVLRTSLPPTSQRFPVKATRRPCSTAED